MEMNGSYNERPVGPKPLIYNGAPPPCTGGSETLRQADGVVLSLAEHSSLIFKKSFKKAFLEQIARMCVRVRAWVPPSVIWSGPHQDGLLLGWGVSNLSSIWSRLLVLVAAIQGNPPLVPLVPLVPLLAIPTTKWHWQLACHVPLSMGLLGTMWPHGGDTPLWGQNQTHITSHNIAALKSPPSVLFFLPSDDNSIFHQI